MTTLYLIRHGTTDWTGQRIIGNLPGIHLNENGRVQARKAADYLIQFPIQFIHASPMARAMETAAPLAERLNLPVTPREFLREINFGELQGAGDELNSSPVWLQFQTHPAEVTFPGGESVADAQQRVVTGLQNFFGTPGAPSHAACFAHCEILRLAVAFALHMPLDDFMRLTIKPGSITCLEWEKDSQHLMMLNLIP